MKRRNTGHVTLRPGMSRKRAGLRMLVAQMNIRHERIKRIEQMVNLLVAKVQRLKQVRAERSLRELLGKLGLLQ